MSSDPTSDAADGTSDPSIAEIEALLAELDIDDLELAPVPDAVWAGIEQQLADEPPAQAPAGVEPAEVQRAELEPADAPATPANVVSIGSRRRRATAWVLLAAAAVALVVSTAVVVIGGGSDTEVISTAALSFDPDAFDPRGADATASAELVEHDGRLEIRLTDARLPDVAGEDLQLWLIEPDSSGQPVDVAPVALLDGGTTYAVPDGLDPDSHFVVDISIEPRDGDAAHSGHSILRGALQPARDQA